MRTKREKCEALRVVDALLCERYPEAECALEYEGDAWKLLIMGRLSAQCTDAKVNAVCKELFAKYPDFHKMAEANVEDVEKIIKPCGLYKMKAKNLVDSSRMLRDEYGGTLPDTMDALLRFPGVGRKIANLLLGDIFHTGGVVADTHCIRICGRLGLSSGKDPEKVEQQLRKILPPEESSDFCHRIVLFGRDCCTARNPKCDECPLTMFCKEFNP